MLVRLQFAELFSGSIFSYMDRKYMKCRIMRHPDFNDQLVNTIDQDGKPIHFCGDIEVDFIKDIINVT